MEETYISICAHLRNKLTALEHVDLFNDQYNNERKENPFSMPATFIEFAPIADWKTNSDGSQTGTLIIQFHHVTPCHSDTQNADRMQPIEQSLAFKHMQYCKQAHRVLQNYAPANCSELIRIQSIPGQLSNQEYIYIEVYQCQYTDNSTSDSAKEWESITPDLKVERPIDRPADEINEFPTPQQFIL